MQLHEAGVFRLRYIVSVELDAERSGVFAAWLAARRLRHPIVHLQFGDITQLSSVAFEQTLRRIGGGHVVVGGSPCNNLSGRCDVEERGGALTFSRVRQEPGVGRQRALRPGRAGLQPLLRVCATAGRRQGGAARVAAGVK